MVIQLPETSTIGRSGPGTIKTAELQGAKGSVST